MWSYAAGFASIPAAAWSKTSFAITLLRITDGWMKRFVWFIIITVNIVLGVNGVIQWVQCWPVQKLWEPKLHGTCMPSMVVQKYNTFVSGEWLAPSEKTKKACITVLTSLIAYSGAMDIVLALLPWKIIWNVTIGNKEKFGALFAMSMGVL